MLKVRSYVINTWCGALGGWLAVMIKVSPFTVGFAIGITFMAALLSVRYILENV